MENNKKAFEFGEVLKIPKIIIDGVQKEESFAIIARDPAITIPATNAIHLSRLYCGKKSYPYQLQFNSKYFADLRWTFRVPLINAKELKSTGKIAKKLLPELTKTLYEAEKTENRKRGFND